VVKKYVVFFVVVLLVQFAFFQQESPVKKVSANNSPFDYLIVATKEIQESSILNPFIAFKESQGYVSQLISPEDLVSESNGSDQAEKIRNYLKKNYLASGFKYVLFIGDPMSSKQRDKKSTGGSLPMRYCYPFPDKHSTENSVDKDVNRIPTDLYYADLTGDWDSDKDGYFGEFGEDRVNLVPELFIGRIPFDDEDDIQMVLEKSMEFEKRDSTTKKKSLLAIASNSYDSELTDSAVLGELMGKNYLEKNGYTKTTLYEQEGRNPSEFTSNYPLDEENLLQQLNKNTTGFSLVLSNGGWMDSLLRKVWMTDKNYDNKPDPEESEWLPLLSADKANDLIPEQSTIYFLSGYMPSAPDWNEDCISKILLKTNGSAVIGETRLSYFQKKWKDESDGGLLSIIYYFFRNLTSEKTIGESLYKSFSYTTSTDWFNAYSFGSIYGDPTISLKNVSSPQIKAPTAPRNLKAEQSGKNVILSWLPSSKGTYPIDGYTIFRSTSSGTESYIVNTSADVQTWEDSKVQPGTRYYYLIKAIDTKKNYSDQSNRVSIQVKEAQTQDITPPSIEIISPENNALLTDSTVSVVGKVSDDESGVDNLTINSKSIIFDQSGNFSTLLKLKEGSNSIAIIATDKSGNIATEILSVIYQKSGISPEDSIPPHIKIVFPSNGDSFTEEVIEVNGRIWDDESGIDKASLNDKSISLRSDGNFTTPLTLTSGTNKISIKAWDKKGNQNSEEIFVIYKKEMVIQLSIGDKIAKINNQDYPLDVPPLIIKGRTFVPLRFISEAFGAEVNWDGETRSVRIFFEKTNSRVTLQIDNPIARVNEKVVKLDAPPAIVGGRTMVPIRFIAEAFGADVLWDGETKTVTIRMEL
jgi:hypothetical protein